MTIEYRQATADDIEGVLMLLVDMHQESGLLALDIDKTIAAVQHVVGNGLCLIACDGDEVVGTLGIVHDSMWYSSEPYVADRWWYVRKDYRKTRIAQTLLKLTRAYAIQNNLKLVMGVMSPVEPSRKDKLFKGWTYLGAAFGEGITPATTTTA